MANRQPPFAGVLLSDICWSGQPNCLNLNLSKTFNTEIDNIYTFVFYSLVLSLFVSSQNRCRLKSQILYCTLSDIDQAVCEVYHGYCTAKEKSLIF